MVRTHHSNRFSTEIASEMGTTDLSAVVLTTAEAPASPCYLVIDYDIPASAEVILFDGTFDGTTFVTTSLANRYLEGSAAESGLTHAVGAKVISAPLGTSMEDLWDQVDAHAAATSPHSATAAATASRLVVRDASGRAAFASPSATGDASTKGYADAKMHVIVQNGLGGAVASRPAGLTNGFVAWLMFDEPTGSEGIQSRDLVFNISGSAW